MGLRTNKLQIKPTGRAALLFWGLILLLAACGTPSPVPTGSLNPIALPTPTLTPPFRALPDNPATPTERFALVPTPTSLPTRRPTSLPTPTPTIGFNYIALPTFGLPLASPGLSVGPTLTSGSQIAYVQEGNLWTIDESGLNPHRLTEEGNISSPTTAAPDLVWTNTGDRVAYINTKNELVIVTLGPEAQPPFFFKPTLPNLSPVQPAWSPDGRSLAFTLKPMDLAATFGGEVWIVELQGTTPLLQKVGDGFGSAWSSDGRFLAYLTRTGEKESRTPLTPEPTSFVGPTPAGTPLLPPTLTPTVSPISLDNNSLNIYTVETKNRRRLFQTRELPGYPSIDGQRTYEAKPSALATLWWSPDNRYIAFADQNSYLGVVAAGGGTPTMWAGLPNSFTVQKVIWLPSSTKVLFSWNNPGSDDRTFLALISNLGTAPRTGEAHPDPMSSKGRLTILPSERVLCPALSPAGDLIAYSDPTLQALLVVRLDWSVYSLMPGADCAIWSPNGRLLATTLRNADNMIATLSPDLSNLLPFSQTKGASRLYWQRPEQLPTDLTLLTPIPANTPLPNFNPIKPDKISPPPDGSDLYAPTAITQTTVVATPTVPR
ncbi:MAG: PD40 domain-containing protein [Chloroflexi bacterium]|nr:PD40 domain-containing protein [Chloroflexota bacterium]